MHSCGGESAQPSARVSLVGSGRTVFDSLPAACRKTLRRYEVMVGRHKQAVCGYGHRMVEGNLYKRPDGQRQCLTCKREILRGRKSGSVEIGSQAGQPVSGGHTRMSPTIAGSSPASPTKISVVIDEPEGPLCRDCEGPLRIKNGKYVCCVIGCSQIGMEQGRV